MESEEQLESRKILINMVNSVEQDLAYYREMHGDDNAWDTAGLTEEFEVLAFLAPYCAVKRKSDGVRGSVMFQHSPRVYFNFKPEEE